MKRSFRRVTLAALGCVLFLLGIMAFDGMAADPAIGKVVDTKDPGTGVVAYYFHGSFRCRTCLAIERQARETIAAGFPQELASGALRWQPINVEEPANEHFVKDFSLVTRSLVLVSYRDGTVQRFQTLDKVWQLVRDEEMFSDYVSDSTRNFLTGG